MSCANSSLAKTEIIKQIGYFPAFLIPALDSSPIYRSLTQQTLFAYINNPLPAVFKEKLFVALARYCGIAYFTICHSCTLYSLGLSAAEILELGELKYPQSEAEAIADLQSLTERWQENWQNIPHLTTYLLHCAIFIFLQPEQAVNFSADLKKLIGTVRYHYLVILLGYIKLCHQWVKSHPEISYREDRRSQLYLGSLLLEETELAGFFQNRTPRSPSPTQIAVEKGKLAIQIAHLKLDRKIHELDLENKERLNISIAGEINNLAQILDRGKLHDSIGKPTPITGISTEIVPPELSQINAATEERSPNTLFTTTQLEAIADVLPYYLFIVDAKTKKILLLNSLLAKSLGISNCEAIGKSCAECFDSEYAERIIKHHQRAISCKRILQFQEEVTLADRIHYLDTTIAPLEDAAGVYAVLHTSNEIPDLAATQEILTQRTIQLEAANKELESFSFSVSHDLQAPLRVINGFSQVLWENYQPKLDERGQHYLQRIQLNSKRMSDSIDALLELSRVTRSQMKSVRVNLSAIALDIVEELKIEFPERQVEVQIASNLETTADPQLLRIVLSNLLNNAWKYTSARSQAKIEFNTLASDEGQTTYYVRDNGAGFNLKYADKLFIPFQRLHSQAEFPGTGIGLATVQRIIYRHGGKVWAEGECDRGATIYFSL